MKTDVKLLTLALNQAFGVIKQRNDRDMKVEETEQAIKIKDRLRKQILDGKFKTKEEVVNRFKEQYAKIDPPRKYTKSHDYAT